MFSISGLHYPCMFQTESHLLSLCKMGEKMENYGTGRRQGALGDVEQQGLFSTAAGSVGSSPKAEPSFFVLHIFYLVQNSGFQDLLMQVTLISLFLQAALVPDIAAE